MKCYRNILWQHTIRSKLRHFFWVELAVLWPFIPYPPCSASPPVAGNEASAGVWTNTACSCPALTTAAVTSSARIWKTATTTSENRPTLITRPRAHLLVLSHQSTRQSLWDFDAKRQRNTTAIRNMNNQTKKKMLKWYNPQESFWLSAHLYPTGFRGSLSHNQRSPLLELSPGNNNKKNSYKIYTYNYIFL